MDEGHTENSFFVMNVKRDFVRMLNRDGYTPIGKRDVVSLYMRKVDEPFLKYWKSSGVEGADEVHNLFMLKSLHIEPDYVEDLKKGRVHAPHRRAADPAEKAKHRWQLYPGDERRVSRDADFTGRTGAIINVLHIDPAYLTSLKKVGYDHLDRSRDPFPESGAHVTADSLIKGFRGRRLFEYPGADAGCCSKMRECFTPELAKEFIPGPLVIPTST